MEHYGATLCMAYQQIFPRSGTKSKKRKVVREGPYTDIYIM